MHAKKPFGARIRKEPRYTRRAGQSSRHYRKGIEPEVLGQHRE